MSFMTCVAAISRKVESDVVGDEWIGSEMIEYPVPLEFVHFVETLNTPTLGDLSAFDHHIRAMVELREAPHRL